MRATLTASLCCAAGILLLARGAPLGAQDGSSLAAGADQRAAAPSRLVTLELENVPLRDALKAVAAQGGVSLIYASSTLPAGRRVTVRVNGAPAIEALRVVLRDTDVEVRETASGQVMLVRRGEREEQSEKEARQPGAVLSGRVTDSATGAVVVRATVSLDAGSRRTTTNDAGQYTFADVPEGVRVVSVRRIGYAPLERTIVVSGSGGLSVDFALVPVASRLDEVVTTVTGPQERRQLGNAITVIRTDSIIARAPVMSISDVMMGRAAGVQVFQPGGLTGAAPQINIRGQNSLSLSNQPIMIVDGVRLDNSAIGRTAPGLLRQTPQSGRLNDIPIADVESVEIVRGPSASTLYGTDAANGVIVVRTKRGGGGQSRWTIFGEGGRLTVDRNRFGENFYPWGHTAAGTQIRCTLLAVAARTCVQDSLTAFSPLRDPSTTPIGIGTRWSSGIQVTGGLAIPYMFSATVDEELGVLKMPEADRALLAVQRGGSGFTGEELHPNGTRRYTVRSNATLPLNTSSDIAISASVLQQRFRVPGPAGLVTGVVSTGVRDDSDGWRAGARPGDDYIGRRREDVIGFVGSATGTWHIVDWLTGRATAGIDYSNSYFDELLRAGEAIRAALSAGSRSNVRLGTTIQSGDVGMTALNEVRPGLTMRTAVGAQYTRRLSVLTAATAQQLAPGTETVAGGAIQTSREGTTEAVVAGGYAEQMIGLRERLFLTGALRVDGASSFGRGLQTALYPKASLSWMLSEEPSWPRIPGVSSLRIRGAIGQSGVQPGAVAALESAQAFQALVDGAVTTGIGVGVPGNPTLRPERQREIEGGLDLELLHGRWSAEVTYYDKRSTDALVSVTTPSSFGGLAQWANVASVRNWGWEFLLHGTLIDHSSSRLLGSLNGSLNDNRVLDIAPGVDARYVVGDPSIVRGYPLFSYFDYPITGYADQNGDGILEASEVQVGDVRAYRGRSYPRTQLSSTIRLALWRGRVELGATADHRGGFAIRNAIERVRCSSSACRAVADPSAPLAQQATAVANLTGQLRNTFWGFIEDGSFTRLREASLTLALPRLTSRWLGLQEPILTIAGRNLALWTRYSGTDPEVLAGFDDAPRGAFTDGGAIPPATVWTARLTLRM